MVKDIPNGIDLKNLDHQIFFDIFYLFVQYNIFYQIKSATSAAIVFCIGYAKIIFDLKFW